MTARQNRNTLADVFIKQQIDIRPLVLGHHCKDALRAFQFQSVIIGYIRDIWQAFASIREESFQVQPKVLKRIGWFHNFTSRLISR